MKISESEYKSLKFFIDTFFALYMMPDALGARLDLPSEILNKIELISHSKARKGIQMAVNDVIEMSSGWGQNKIIEADKKLVDAGALALSVVRIRYSKNYLKILERKELKNEAEYFMIKGIIDGGVISLGTPEAALLQAMLDVYENNASKPMHKK